MQRQLLTENAASYGPPTHYALLGVSPTSSLEVIKQAYRTQVFRHHPDRNQGNQAASDMMVRINEAYSVLSDPDKRKSYDIKIGIGVNQPPVASPSNKPGSFWRPPGAIQPQAMDQDFFRARPTATSYPQPTQYNKAVLSHSMYVKPPSTKDRQIMWARGYQPCGNCRGIGVIPSEFNVTTVFCKFCQGTGYVARIKG